MTCGKCSTSKCGTNVAVPVTATAAPVSLTWDQLGVTETNAIQQISFALSDPCDYSSGTCVTKPYSVSINIDDLKLTN